MRKPILLIPLILFILIAPTKPSYYKQTNDLPEELRIPEMTAETDDDSEFLSRNTTKFIPFNECKCVAENSVVSEYFLVCFGMKNNSYCPVIIPNADVTLLTLRSTNVQAIYRNDSDLDLIKLNYLAIEKNDDLETIVEGFFNGLNSLESLSISFNKKLTYLKKSCFEGLINLKYLKLIKNGFKNINAVSESLQIKNLPNLIDLDLSKNVFNTINENDLSNLNNSKLRRLNLMHVQATFVATKGLNYFPQLNKLEIGYNFLNSNVLIDLLTEMVKNKIPLETLNLASSHISKINLSDLLRIIGQSNVTNLIISKNKLISLDKLTFPSMPNLNVLDLSGTLLNSIEMNTFSSDKFENLSTLILSQNDLSGITGGLMIPQLKILDISHNLNTLTRFNIREADLDFNFNIEILNLSYNKVFYVSKYTFEIFRKLKIVGLKNCSINFIYSKSFEDLKQLEYLNLDNNNLHYNFQRSNISIFNGLTSLKVLLLRECHIEDVYPASFKDLSNLIHLDLSNNEILKLSSEVLKPLINLKYLDLSENLITVWYENILAPKKLEFLSLSSNKITYISQFMFEDFQNIHRVNIEENPFHCHCLLFKEILQNISQYNDPEKITGSCLAPDDWQKKPLVEFIKYLSNNTCDYQVQSMKNIHSRNFWQLFMVLFFVILSAFMILILFVSRRRFQYWIFLIKLKFYSTSNQIVSLPSTLEYTYDAFISYCSSDSEFISTLIEKLEEHPPFLKLCVYERDFEIGTFITDAILEKLSKSRRIILIISDSFAKSQWCRWETQLAENRRLFLNDTIKDAIILIRLGDVNKEHLTPMLKYLMKTRIYLDWNGCKDPSRQKIFWDKLRFSLSSN